MTRCILTLFLIDQMVDYEMPATEKLPAADEFAGMKASALDLRERVVKFMQGGGSKVEAAQRFGLARVPFTNV
jgi:hypothetical protein